MIRVYTSGTYDLFHIGHLNVIRRSRELGDYLVVGVSTDELVASYKMRKPIIPFEDRAEIIQALTGVDLVVRQEELFSPKLMSELDIDVMTIGDDWKGKYHPGLEWAQNHPKIEMAFLPYTQSVSTTELKKQIINGWQEDQRAEFAKA
ncbi:MAG: adenylyltransferase/cytidyltransferase family protein [Shimia sp.]|uniref:adenylyltransferase/cytidyltransferase family protein n=1 Tax=Shimia sp. TaxID=1954381 RepID=UPI0040580134